MTMMDTIKDVLGADPLKHADSDMRAVLDAYDALNPKPFDLCTPEEARRQPTLADAVKRVMKQKGVAPEADHVRTQDLTVPCLNGPLPVRVYLPSAALHGEPGKPWPTVLYLHGGGFVTADLGTDDAIARALAQKAQALVVSAHYSLAPERKFPAAHTDANTVWRWLADRAESLGGDATCMAVVGEGAGGNLAANVALFARDQGLPMPVALGLICPMADTSTLTLSYEENRNARPLNKAALQWSFKHCLAHPGDKDDQRLRLTRQDLTGLPPTSVITAGIDPLRSEGEDLVRAMEAAGVMVRHRHFPGATHGFLGTAALVQAAREAQDFLVDGLLAMFQAHQTPFDERSELVEPDALPSSEAGSAGTPPAPMF